MSLRDSYERCVDEESGKTISADECPECSGPLRIEGGEISCRDCGLLIEQNRIDHGPEWTSFGDDTGSTGKRTGAPLTPARHDRGLSAEIGYGGDAKGKPLSSRKRRRIARMRREHGRARWQSRADRNLAHACGEILRMTGALELPRIVGEEGCAIYRRAQDADLIKGRSIEALAAGSLYAACRCRGYPRSRGEVAAVARCDGSKVTLGYRVLNVELGLDTQVVGVGERIPQLATGVGAPNRVQYRARELASLAEDEGVANGRNPSGVAAACLYLAGEEFDSGYTQAELARCADVAPATLRERYYELQELCDGGPRR